MHWGTHFGQSFLTSRLPEKSKLGFGLSYLLIFHNQIQNFQHQWLRLYLFCWRSRMKRGFSGNKGLHVRSGVAASCEPAQKTVRSEGSLAKPNLCPQSPFFCFLFFGEAKKTRSPKEDEFLRSKNGAFVRRIRFNKVKIRPLYRGLVFA